MNDLAELCTIGFHDEVNCPAIDGSRFNRPNYGNERTSGSYQTCGALLDLAADHVKHEIDAPDFLERIICQIDELVRAKLQRLLPVGGTSGGNDVGSELARKLRRDRTDRTGGAMNKDALACLEAAMLRQSLPGGQAGDRQAATVNSTSPGSGTRLRASTATYSARVPSRYQSVRPNTRCPKERPVVP